MSESKVIKKAAETSVRSFTVRNIQKRFNKFCDTPVTTKEFHQELGKENNLIIVEDRPCDWLERANKDADSVGLANVLSIVEKQGLDVRSFAAFNDSEALDLSELDPMDPNAYEKSKKAQTKALAELEATASKMGVTVDSLVKAALSGRVEDLIKTTVEKEEGDK